MSMENKKRTIWLKGGGSATITGKPTPELLEALNTMVELAKKKLSNPEKTGIICTNIQHYRWVVDKHNLDMSLYYPVTKVDDLRAQRPKRIIDYTHPNYFNDIEYRLKVCKSEVIPYDEWIKTLTN